MMTNYFTVSTDAKTGKKTTIPWTEDEIKARQERIRAMTPTPSSITPRQCRLILAQQGLLASVEAMIAQRDEATRITWEYALEFRRDDPLLLNLGQSLNLTPQQIDEFFIAAAKL
jgi:hypothetical protein